jgi:2-keto-3-deoxy-L-rhamnonate aldolase RhmA
VSPTPRWRDSPLAETLAKILETTHAAGKMAGIFCVGLEFAADMKKLGYDFVVLSNDAALLRGAAQQWVGALR